MALADFYAMISDAVNQQDRLDNFIPVAVRQAVRWLERNYTFRYMSRREQLTLADASSSITLDAYVKTINEATILKTATGSEVQVLNYDRALLVVDPTEACPETFRVMVDGTAGTNIGNDDLIMLFDKTSDQAYPVMTLTVRFTQWLSLGYSDTHWLLDHAEDVVLNRALVQMKQFLRDPELIADAEQVMAEGLRTLLIAEEAIVEPAAGTRKIGFGA